MCKMSSERAESGTWQGITQVGLSIDTEMLATEKSVS